MSEEEENRSTLKSVTGVLQSFTQLQKNGKLCSNDANELQRILGSSQTQGMINMYDKLAQIRGEAGIQQQTTGLSIEIKSELEKYDDEKCRELFRLMNNPYFCGVIDAYDNVKYEAYGCNPVLPAEVCLCESIISLVY